MIHDTLALYPFKFVPHFQKYKLYLRFLSYRPNFEIQVETSKYILKTATRFDELYQVFKLRYDVFLNDYNDVGASSVDVDEFDDSCDHIVIIDKSSHKIVGTYRVISSLFTHQFYSHGEFKLDKFLESDGNKLELGRACIHPTHRNGAVIDLLWKGIARYIKMTDSRYMFGCSSIKVTDGHSAGKIYQYFKQQDNLSEEFSIGPQPEFDFQLFEPESIEESGLKPLVPPLLRSYLTAGAKIYGRPALDEEFHCIDFLTILDMNNINPSYFKRYFR